MLCRWPSSAKRRRRDACPRRRYRANRRPTTARWVSAICSCPSPFRWAPGWSSGCPRSRSARRRSNRTNRDRSRSPSNRVRASPAAAPATLCIRRPARRSPNAAAPPWPNRRKSCPFSNPTARRRTWPAVLFHSFIPIFILLFILFHFFKINNKEY